MATLKLFPNPYAALDHLGRLAGSVAVFESVRAVTAMPLRELVGAKLTVLSSVQVDRSLNHLDTKSDYLTTYEKEPVEIHADGIQSAYHYQQHVQRGELFDACKGVPLDALKKARAKAIADWTAMYGSPPDTATWEQQFPLEREVRGDASTAAPELPAVSPPEETTPARKTFTKDAK